MSSQPNRTNERTPLLTTVIVTPPRPSTRFHRAGGTSTTLRRFCTLCLAFTLVVVLILFLVPAHYFPGVTSPSAPSYHSSSSSSRVPGYEELKQILLRTPDEGKVREWSEYYTSGQHLAGRNKSQAEWTRGKWEGWGVKSVLEEYEVWMNYPVGHRLALVETVAGVDGDGEEEEEQGKEGKVRYEASLEEDVLPEDPTTGLDDRVMTFHGYGASGNVTARYVYANFGTFWDFEDLVNAGVELRGNIALVKYGRGFRGLKVKRAEELGMVGVVIYTDPQEDGEVIEQNGYEAYPDGPARNPSSVQRGSVQYINVLSGDPTTPGYASKPGVERVDPNGTVPSIPSLPISYRDALPILKALNGHGPKASEFNEFWQGGKLDYKGVEYNIGPSPAGLELDLMVEHEYVITPQWDVIGIINGTLQDEVVILGNHRDAWIAGGAADPNSGSAALNEVIRSFGEALKLGWKPLRTIVFASWDGEEYGLIGSTEWVEQYMPWLKETAVAYLNVDVGARGPLFGAAASPLLNKALYEATSAVQSPNQTVEGQTVRDLWDGRIRTMGSGSDFTAFQDFAGIPCVDLEFDTDSKSAVYHYHSNYDSFAWMDRFGDRDWHYHVTITKVWALFAAALVETPVLQFNVTDYAIGLQHYLQSVKYNASISTLMDQGVGEESFPVLEGAISALYDAAVAFDAKAESLAKAVREGLPWWKRWWSGARLHSSVKAVNDAYKYFERQFLFAEGLDSRPIFKHVVFAPGIWTGYSGATFPGLIESIDNGDMENVKRWTAIIKEKIDQATALIS